MEELDRLLGEAEKSVTFSSKVGVFRVTDESDKDLKLANDIKIEMRKIDFFESVRSSEDKHIKSFTLDHFLDNWGAIYFKISYSETLKRYLRLCNAVVKDGTYPKAKALAAVAGPCIFGDIFNYITDVTKGASKILELNNIAEELIENVDKYFPEET